MVRWAEFFEVSTSGYYEWKQTKEERAAEAKAFEEEVKEIFEGSNGTYGADRIVGELRKRGKRASYRKVKRAMKAQGLKSVHQRRTKSLTDSRKARGEGYENLLRNGPKITEPLRALSSDISYIPTGEGFLYMCQIKDIVSGVILAQCMSSQMNKELVLNTIKAAHKRYDLGEGTIFHSDRGSQYTSKEVKELLCELGYRQSFSRVGMPGDNAWSESFFSILKKEAVYPDYFETREEAREVLFVYVECFYNRYRIQKGLGYLTPIEWLERYCRSRELRSA